MQNLEYPSAFDFRDEPVPKLARFKQVRAGKWSLRSSKSLSEMAELAVYVLALERYAQGVEIGEFVSRNVPFRGNYDIWSPAAPSIAIGSRSARMLGQENRAKEIFSPVLVNPAHVINRYMIEQTIREAYGKLSEERSLVLIVRNHVAYLEEAYAGRPETEWYPILEMESQMNQALALIRQSLQPKNKRWV